MESLVIHFYQTEEKKEKPKEEDKRKPKEEDKRKQTDENERSILFKMFLLFLIKKLIIKNNIKLLYNNIRDVELLK